MVLFAHLSRRDLSRVVRLFFLVLFLGWLGVAAPAVARTPYTYTISTDHQEGDPGDGVLQPGPRNDDPIPEYNPKPYPFWPGPQLRPFVSGLPLWTGSPSWPGVPFLPAGIVPANWQQLAQLREGRCQDAP